MRGTSTGLTTPYPLSTVLPSVLQEDELLTRLTEAIDHLPAPAISSLDCLEAYIDAALTPPDFLPWLASWVGADLDETWLVELQRAAVAGAVELHRDRGTLGGLRRHLQLFTGGDVEVTDNGGVTWSAEPTEDHGSQPPPRVRVVVYGNRIGETALLAAVDAAKPAHVAHEVTVSAAR
ncbi:phage tail protein I [Kribbella sp. NPDC026611]|uniref:phage tail protein I n=1 Tax=Kribbella sp. NPDC026611 TaxID=3154911 RepID=UPI0033FA8ECD